MQNGAEEYQKYRKMKRKTPGLYARCASSRLTRKLTRRPRNSSYDSVAAIETLFIWGAFPVHRADSTTEAGDEEGILGCRE